MSERINWVWMIVLCVGFLLWLSNCAVAAETGEKAPVTHWKSDENKENIAEDSSDDWPRMVDVFVGGQDDYHTYRIPSLITTQKGTLLAICEGRKLRAADESPTNLVIKRSFDGGKTWAPMQVVVDAIPDAAMDSCPILDRATGTVWMVYDRWPAGGKAGGKRNAGLGMDSVTAWVTSSTDDGATWSEPVNITKMVKKPEWRSIIHGPGVGIQTRSGRFVVPCLQLNEWRSFVIYSDDQGRTWHRGGQTAVWERSGPAATHGNAGSGGAGPARPPGRGPGWTVRG